MSTWATSPTIPATSSDELTAHTDTEAGRGNSARRSDGSVPCESTSRSSPSQNAFVGCRCARSGDRH
jgi:hypothetical protein